MNFGSRIILILFAVFIAGIFYWALFTPKEDISQRIYQTLKDQEKRADLSFKGVEFEEVVAGVKYWKLSAKDAVVNKSTGIATLQGSRGTFYKNGKPVLSFRSPAAMWDMNKKEIYLDKPLGYDVLMERKINTLLKTIQKQNLSIFNLPALYEKGMGYWFKANNLSWKLTDQMLVCRGNIMLTKGEITVYAEKLQGDVAMEKVLLEGNPKSVIQPSGFSPITIEARAFEIISAEDTITAQGTPRIVWEEAVITSDAIKYIQAEKLIQLAGNVLINYKDIKAWGNTAKYYPAENNIVVKGEARAEQGENKISGAKVSVSLKEKKISVVGRGKAVIGE